MCCQERAPELSRDTKQFYQSSVCVLQSGWVLVLFDLPKGLILKGMLSMSLVDSSKPVQKIGQDSRSLSISLACSLGL